MTALTTLVLMSSSLPAWADNTISDGDAVAPITSPIGNDDMALGDLCQGDIVERTVPIAVTRNGAAGSTNVFKNSSTVTVSVLSISGTGLSAVMGSPNTIAIPSNWSTQANNTQTSFVTSTVTFEAPSLGSFAGSVTFRGAGVNSSNAARNRDDVMNVTANVIECVPPDTEPPVVTVTAPAPDGNDSWFVTKPVLVDATATDDAGIASVDCTPIYGETSSDATSSSGTVSVSDEETTVVSCTATDNNGNTSEAVTAAVQIDTVAPSITDDGVVAGTLGDNGWYVSPVTNQFSADDSTSGLADCAMTFTKSTGASEEGSAVVVSSGACSDLAGNANPGIDSAAFMIDMSAPNPPDAYVDPAANPAGWNNSVPVTVSFTDNGDNGPSGVAACTTDQALTVETTASGETVDGTCTDFAGNVSDPTSLTVKVDLTDPTITFQSRTPANGFGWNNGPVTVEWSCLDALSGAVDATVMQTVSGEGENQSAAGTCYDVADNSASDTANDIDIDLTKPSVAVTGVADGAVYVLGSVPTPGCDTTDALSGVATPASLSVTGGPVGFVTATCDGAQDKAGNPGDPASATYQVVYDFNGFFRPIDNSTPSYVVLNVTKAGSSIPSKFSLNGYQGLGILAAGSPTSKQVACGAADSTDVIEQTMTAGNSTLTYDEVVDQYVYVWKSDKLWAGTCRRLDVALVDGTTHSAFFKFTK